MAASPKYKGKKIPRVVVYLGEHKKVKYFSRVIKPVQVALGLPIAKEKDLEVIRDGIVYYRRGSLFHVQYKILLLKRTPKKNRISMSLPVPQGLPLYRVKKLIAGKKGIYGIKTPLGVTHTRGI